MSVRSLVVTHTVPWPARGGGAMRAAHTIAALARLGPVDVACIVQPTNTAPTTTDAGVDRVVVLHRPRRRGGVARRVRWLLTGRLPSARSADYSAMRSRFAAWAGRYDLVWLGCGTEAFVALGTALPSDAAVVANLDDLEDHKLASRLAAGPIPCAPSSPRALVRGPLDRFVTSIEVRRWRRLHERLAARADRVVVCSDLERDALRALGITNCLPIPNVYPDPGVPLGRTGVGTPPTLSMVGTLDYAPNADAARFMVECVLPELRARVPEVSLRLVGRSGPATSDLAETPGVVMTGQVDDLDPELSRADIAVVPIRFGGGTRIKILEAFAHRIPVVSTTLGAEGLGVTDGVELLIADDPADIADACARLVSDAPLRARIVTAAAAYWSAQHRPEALEEQVVAIARDVAGATREPNR